MNRTDWVAFKQTCLTHLEITFQPAGLQAESLPVELMLGNLEETLEF